MNPVFWLLVIAAAMILWVVFSFVFIPLGRLLFKKWDKTVEILNKEDEEKEKKEWEENQDV